MTKPQKDQQLTKIEITPDSPQETNPNLVLKKDRQQIVIQPATMQALLRQPETKSVGKGKENTQLSDELHSLDLLADQKLSLHGIRTVEDVIKFLKSPAGKEEEKLRQELLADLILMLQNRQLDYLHKFMILLRIKAFISLMAHRRKDLTDKALYEAYRKEIDAIHERSNKNSTHTNSDHSAAAAHHMEQIYAAYSLSARILESTLTRKHQEALTLEKELELLEQEIQHMTHRYSVYEKHLDMLDELVDTIDAEFAEGSVDEKIQSVEAKITLLNGHIRDLISQIQENLQQGEHAKAMEHMLELEGYNLQMMGLESLFSVLKNEKSYCDIDGNPTPSYKTANFILPANQKLHRDNETGKLLLLNSNQNPQFMSRAEKDLARLSYKTAKPEIATFRTTLTKNSELENAFYDERKLGLLQQSTQMQEEILNLTNQYRVNQTALQKTALLQNRPEFRITPAIPTPAPAPVPTQAPVPKPLPTQAPILKPFTITQSYRDVLELIRLNPTPAAINQFRNSLVNLDGTANKTVQDTVKKSLKPGEPLLPATMQNLLQRLERMGLPASNKSATPNPVATSPNPLSTTPSPLKK